MVFTMQQSTSLLAGSYTLPTEIDDTLQWEEPADSFDADEEIA